jgi:hypothetical protein
MPGLMTFTATLRETGSFLLSHVNDAKAALADLFTQFIGADLLANRFRFLKNPLSA